MEKRGKVNLPYLSKAENMDPISSNIPPLIDVSLKPKPNYANQVTQKLRENNLIGNSFFFLENRCTRLPFPNELQPTQVHGSTHKYTQT